MHMFNYKSFVAFYMGNVTIHIWKPLKFWALTFSGPDECNRWALEFGPVEIWRHRT
jgi:hypothetical protein